MKLDLNFANFTVLVVDDNPVNLQIASRVLGKVGYKIIVSLSAVKAFDMLSKNIPDLILLDVMMPEMNGFEFASKLSQIKEFKSIPIVFLTAKSDSIDVVQGFNLGGLDYITKPFNNEELISRINNQILIKHTKDLIKKKNIILTELVEEKNEILAIAAHDLKNPLSAIYGYAELIEKYNDRFSPEELIYYNSVIKNTAKKMLNIISDILESSASHTERMSVCPVSFYVNELFNEIIESYLFKAETKNIKITTSFLEEDIEIYNDMLKISQIFDNLLSNAIKYSPFDKNIYIKIEILNVDKQYLKFSIRDEGPGFTDEDKSKMYSKFTRLSAVPTNDESSTGLGLSIIKKIIDLLNGEIKLISSEGNGAEFIVSLPMFDKNIEINI